MPSYLVTRDVSIKECNWLKETITKGTVVYGFYGATYGCIGPSGIAVSWEEDKNPFFELPYNALKELPIR